MASRRMAASGRMSMEVAVRLARAVLCTLVVLIAHPAVTWAQYTEVWSATASLGTVSLSPYNFINMDGGQAEMVVSSYNGGGWAVQIRNAVTGAVLFTSTTTSPMEPFDIYPVDLDTNMGHDHILAVTKAGLGSPTVILIAYTGSASAPAPASGEALFAARPNPFGGQVALTYTLATPGMAELEVYDVAGRLVRRLGGDRMEAGEHRVNWDGRDQGGRSLDAGVYFYRLKVDGRASEPRKAIRLGQ